MSAPEGTITEGGLSNPAQGISYTLVEAVDAPGYMFKVSATAGSMNKTTAIGDCPSGYNIKSSVPAYLQAMVQLVEGAAVTGAFLGIQALVPGQEAYLQLDATAATIAAGDFITCAASTQTAGKVQPRNTYTSSGACYVFARALEAKAANAGGTVKVKIMSPSYLPTGVY
jgi:hypothetical protein